MGILEKLRAEFVDIVEWVDDDRQSIVWRFPRYHNQIKQGAKLIVRPGQLAVFVHRGKLADRFSPGTHTLATGNLPMLSTIAGWSHGFNSPFKAEVYFVATRQVTDLKWGTPNPVVLRDPELGPIRVRGFGNYTLKAANPERLLTEIVGADSELEASEIGDLLRSIIASEFADLIAASDIPVIDLAANYRILAEKLRNGVLDRVRDEFGLDVPQLVLANVSVPEEVERAFDARSSMSVIGDLARYQQYQVGQSMPIAAANPAGGLAGAGVGLGMGLAAVGTMSGSAVATMPPPLASAGPATVWHVEERGRATGPFTQAQIDDAIAAGRVTPATLVWSPGMAAWARAGETPALATRFGPPPLPR